MNQSQLTLYRADFTQSTPQITSIATTATTGETGLHDVFRVSGSNYLVSSRRADGTVPLRQFDSGSNVFTTRSDLPTGENRVSGRSFFAGSASPYSRSGILDALVYHNDFENGSAFLDDFTVGSLGTGSVSVVNGELQLNAGTSLGTSSHRSWVTTPATKLISQFNPKLSLNEGVLTWAWNQRNQDGAYNNAFSFGLTSLPDYYATSNFGYYLAGGGFVGNRMLFTRFANYQSSYGPITDYLVDISDGLSPGSEGAFRITFDPTTGLWNVYFEQGNTPPDPMTISNLIGSFTNEQFTSVNLPHLSFISTTTGHTWIDNFTFTVGAADLGNPMEEARKRIQVIQGEPAPAGFFHHVPDTDSFGSEVANPQVARHAAVTELGDFTAIANGTSTVIFASDGSVVTTLPHSGGLGFSPRARQLFLADPVTDQIRIFSTYDWSEITSIAIPGGLASVTGPFGEGNLEVRPDGLELALICSDGVRLFDLASLSTGDRLSVSELSPATLQADRGNPTPGASTTFTISNPGNSAIEWAVVSEVGWLNLSP